MIYGILCLHSLTLDPTIEGKGSVLGLVTLVWPALSADADTVLGYTLSRQCYSGKQGLKLCVGTQRSMPGTLYI